MQLCQPFRRCHCHPHEVESLPHCAAFRCPQSDPVSAQRSWRLVALAGLLCLLIPLIVLVLPTLEGSDEQSPRELQTAAGYLPGEELQDGWNSKASWLAATVCVMCSNYVAFTSAMCMTQAKSDGWYVVLLLQTAFVRGICVMWAMNWMGLQERYLSTGKISEVTVPLLVSFDPALIFPSAAMSFVAGLLTLHVSWIRNPPAEGQPLFTALVLSKYFFAALGRAASHLAVCYMGLAAQTGYFTVHFKPGGVVGVAVLGLCSSLIEVAVCIFMPHKNLLRIAAAIVAGGLLDGLHFASRASCIYRYSPELRKGFQMQAVDTLLLTLTAGMLAFLNCTYFMEVIAVRDRQQLQKRLLYENYVRTSGKVLQRAKMMRFPMALVRMDIFLAGGKLMSHERMRDASKLLYVDSNAAAARLRKDGLIIFFSHQWLSRALPDPRNRQFDDMKAALEQLSASKDVPPKKVWVWVDYSGIPQLAADQQQLAIDSLPAYAAVCSAFVVVAPQTLHLDHQIPSNFMTYSKRFWCRLEVFCTLLSTLQSKPMKKDARQDDEEASDTENQWTDKMQTPAAKKEGFPSKGSKDSAASAVGGLNAKQRVYLVMDGQLHRLSFFNAQNGLRSEYEKLLYVYEGDLDCCARGHVTASGEEVACDRNRVVETLTGCYGMMYADLLFFRSQRSLSQEDLAAKELVEVIMRKADRIFPEEYFGSRIEAMTEFINRGYKIIHERNQEQDEGGGPVVKHISSLANGAASFLLSAQSLGVDSERDIEKDAEEEEESGSQSHLLKAQVYGKYGSALELLEDLEEVKLTVDANIPTDPCPNLAPVRFDEIVNL